MLILPKFIYKCNINSISPPQSSYYYDDKPKQMQVEMEIRATTMKIRPEISQKH